MSHPHSLFPHEKKVVAEEKKLTEANIDYASLFEFIAKNKELSSKVALLEANAATNPSLKAFANAVKAGNFTDAIFNDPDCDIYLLYLMKTKEVDFWAGITLYTYLTARAQYTERSPFLKETDRASEMIGDVIMYPLLTPSGPHEEQKLSPLGKQYAEGIALLASVFKHALFIDTKTFPEKFRVFLLNLPPSEQYLMALPERVALRNPTEITHITSNNFRSAISSNSVITLKMEVDDKRKIVIPSFAVINFLLKEIPSSTFLLRPVFGSVGPGSLEKMHLKGQHPLSLYQRYVKSNVERVHYAVSQIDVLIHDVLHAEMGGKLTSTERNDLFQLVIPKIKNGKKKLPN